MSKTEIAALTLKRKTFKTRTTQLETYFNKGADTEDQAKNRQTFEDQYFELTSRIEDVLSGEPIIRTDTPALSVNSTSQQVQLPKITLPTFAGVLEDWLTFYSTFDSLINENGSLNNVQRFHYLRSCLTGEASNTIQALSITDANYGIAWTTLRSRYENKKLIIENHINKIFQLPMVKEDSASSIRSHIDTFLKHVNALDVLGEPTRDTLLLHLSTIKLDALSKDKWEEYRLKCTNPSVQELTNFLQERCQVLESRNASKSQRTQLQRVQTPKTDRHQGHSVVSYTNTQAKCKLCHQHQHELYRCNAFHNLNIADRRAEVKKQKLCFNCLKPNHGANECRSRQCTKCDKKHNTLLHDQQELINTHLSTSSDCYSATNDSYKGQMTLLSTTLVIIVDKHGEHRQCRALLDSASQTNFIREDLAASLNINTQSVRLPINGIGNATATTITKRLVTTIRSRINGFKAKLEFYVLPEITQELPANSFSKNQLNIPQNITLADPEFNKRGRIDLLLGAEIYLSLLSIGQIKLTTAQFGVTVQNTQFGWIASGTIPTTNNSEVVTCNLNTLETQIERFWQSEEVNTPLLKTTHCKTEEHFNKTVCRTDEGAFVVRLPFNIDPNNLGDSKNMAIRRFYNLEKRLFKMPVLKKQYVEFMQQYEKLGHMEPINDTNNGYFLPHHCVIKEDSTTTRLRVVFDGSAKTTTGLSLNDILQVGPTVQEDLLSILLRFRIHRYVITADISKMYRQIWIHKDDRQYLRIIWREDPSLPLQIYNLKTVTYGTASAPYLATRSLKQLAIEEQTHYPHASAVVQNDFYVDDCITGTDSLEEAKELQRQLSQMLLKGGFHLHKWRSNNDQILNTITSINQETTIPMAKTTVIKTLGLLWNSSSDSLHFSVKHNIQPTRITKRNILSEIAQLFDPMGLVGPVIIRAKILMQRVWQLKIDWDAAVPMEIHTFWHQYKDDLTSIDTIQIPRHIHEHQKYSNLELHGFCDASEAAYGCCIYIRCKTTLGAINTNLLCAKSKVAPLKTISLPRLELSGAVILARLAKKVKSALKLNFDNEFYWSDSTIALGWIRSPSNKWKTYVANRVTEVQELTNSNWRHVRSHNNPADIISRGVNPTQLKESSLWWHGPKFLQLNQEEWPSLEDIEQSLPDEKPAVALPVIEEISSIITKWSSLSKLKRIVAFCLRYIHNSQGQPKLTGPLTVQEISKATTALLRIAQKEEFKGEIYRLKQNLLIDKSSRLRKLSPFIDEDGLLRVGGRLMHAKLPFNQRNPIILPRNHPLTELIINYEHLKLIHGGAQAVLSAVRSTYWPMAGRNTVKKILHRCLRCCKVNPKRLQPVMGQLPQPRVQPSRAFTNTGVDFCGPFQMKLQHSRGSRTTKGYVSVFVCFATKAIHLELVSSLTTEAFINALKRFMSRRGKPSNLYSDNGTNFTGTHHELARLRELLNSREHKDRINHALLEDNITWHFIPPRSPHFGGL